jgi:hypothetical protein
MTLANSNCAGGNGLYNYKASSSECRCCTNEKTAFTNVDAWTGWNIYRAVESLLPNDADDNDGFIGIRDYASKTGRMIGSAMNYRALLKGGEYKKRAA